MGNGAAVEKPQATKSQSLYSYPLVERLCRENHFAKDTESYKLAMEHSIKKNALDVLEALIPAGNARSLYPLHIGATYGVLDAVELLVSAGFNCATLNRDNLTPLHCAATNRSIESALCATFLALQNPAIMEIPDSNGSLPIHLAVERNNVNVLRCLLELGANLMAKNGKGLAVKQLAQALKKTESIKCIEKMEQLKRDQAMHQGRLAVTSYSPPRPGEVNMERVMQIWERFFENAMAGNGIDMLDYSDDEVEEEEVHRYSRKETGSGRNRGANDGRGRGGNKFDRSTSGSSTDPYNNQAGKKAAAAASRSSSSSTLPTSSRNSSDRGSASAHSPVKKGTAVLSPIAFKKDTLKKMRSWESDEDGGVQSHVSSSTGPNKPAGKLATMAGEYGGSGIVGKAKDPPSSKGGAASAIMGAGSGRAAQPSSGKLDVWDAVMRTDRREVQEQSHKKKGHVIDFKTGQKGASYDEEDEGEGEEDEANVEEESKEDYDTGWKDEYVHATVVDYVSHGKDIREWFNWLLCYGADDWGAMSYYVVHRAGLEPARWFEDHLLAMREQFPWTSEYTSNIDAEDEGWPRYMHHAIQQGYMLFFDETENACKWMHVPTGTVEDYLPLGYDQQACTDIGVEYYCSSERAEEEPGLWVSCPQAVGCEWVVVLGTRDLASGAAYTDSQVSQVNVDAKAESKSQIARGTSNSSNGSGTGRAGVADAKVMRRTTSNGSASSHDSDYKGKSSARSSKSSPDDPEYYEADVYTRRSRGVDKHVSASGGVGTELSSSVEVGGGASDLTDTYYFNRVTGHSVFVCPPGLTDYWSSNGGWQLCMSEASEWVLYWWHAETETSAWAEEG